MPFAVDDVTLTHGDLRHGAMVITPKKPMVLGRERIDGLRGSTSLNKVDRWLIDQAVRRQGRNRVILFRACNGRDERVWQFDPSLSDAELEEAGYVLTCALVPFHRRLLNAGVVLMVHTDWGVRECYAMRHGVRKLEGELKHPKQGVDTAVLAADRWLLSNMLLHVALSLQHVTQRLLPLHLGMIDRRWSQVSPMLSELPRQSID
jgi:hypothetical protein